MFVVDWKMNMGVGHSKWSGHFFGRLLEDFNTSKPTVNTGAPRSQLKSLSSIKEQVYYRS